MLYAKNTPVSASEYTSQSHSWWLDPLKVSVSDA